MILLSLPSFQPLIQWAAIKYSRSRNRSHTNGILMILNRKIILKRWNALDRDWEIFTLTATGMSCVRWCWHNLKNCYWNRRRRRNRTRTSYPKKTNHRRKWQEVVSTKSEAYSPGNLTSSPNETPFLNSYDFLFDFIRTTGLLRRNVWKIEDKPLWYDVYAMHPPSEEPRFDRPAPNIEVRNIFYEEDLIRV